MEVIFDILDIYSVYIRRVQTTVKQFNRCFTRFFKEEKSYFPKKEIGEKSISHHHFCA